MKRFHVTLFLLVIVSVMFIHSSGLSYTLPDCLPSEAPIWNGYCKSQMDILYDQKYWRNEPPDTAQRITTQNTELRKRLGEPEIFFYGDSKDEYAQYENLSLYRSKSAAKAPILVFIHGGAWQYKADSVVPAEMFMDAGAHYIALDFVNVPQTNPPGNLMEMANQVRKAIAWVYKNAKLFKGDEKQLYIAGWSSGGHLCGVAMTTDWSLYGLPKDAIKGGLCFSGMYDLKPVSLSYRNTYVNFTPEVIQELSAINNLKFLNAPIYIINGTGDTPEFQRQSKDFAAAVEAAGKKVVYRIGYGYNHFELPETLGNPYGILGRAALEMMGLEANRGSKK